jgi:hypothetical protein
MSFLKDRIITDFSIKVEIINRGYRMQYYFSTLLLLSLTFMIGCSGSQKVPQYQANWSKLQTGMSKQEVINILGDPPSKSTPACKAGMVESAALALADNDLFNDLHYEHWEYGKFGLFENILFPSDAAYVVYFDSNEKVVSFREPLEYWEKPPYAFKDISPTHRVGGDYLESLAKRTEGVICLNLKPPILLYPDNNAVFCHFPRELVFRWQPARGTPQNIEYLVQIESTSKGDFKQFGSWTDEPPFFTYRTGRTSMNERFCGAQPGRWRVKTIGKTGESQWSEWCYFRFTE